MQTAKTEEKIKKLNYYKILFHKHDTLPVGHFSRNLVNKIKDSSNNKIQTYKEKNSEYFNPISDNNSFKIQKLYSKFQRNKSAKRYTLCSYKKSKNNNLLSHQMSHISQYTTFLDYSKYIANSKFQNNLNLRPVSHLGRDSTLLMDKYFSNNLSKIEKNKNKNYTKKKYTIKKNIQRSSSAFLFNPNNNLTKKIEYLTNNSTIKNLLKHEEQMKEKKKLLKGRLLSALSKHLVINQETLKNYEILYKAEDNKDNEQNNTQKKIVQRRFNFINHNPDIFSKIRPAFRYEDYYYSPMELLTKYFTNEEIIILKSSPGYFGLNKFPFKNSVAFNPTLLSKFDLEDYKVSLNSNNQNNNTERKSQTKKFNFQEELKKIKNIFKERKKEKIKRKPIKGKDFISHYERDIDPDEGTVEYFDRKYLKYLVNKEKKMEKKINNLKFKKSRFEYLKNLRTQKLEEEKNIQRITTPIIDIIKRNYLRVNSNINI